MAKLIVVTAPHFVAGIVVKRDKVVEAAPILGWTQGRAYSWLTRYFNRKRWSIHEVEI